jgi:hypothetical protein
MGEVQKPSNSKCHTPSAEPFIFLFDLVWELSIKIMFLESKAAASADNLAAICEPIV